MASKKFLDRRQWKKLRKCSVDVTLITALVVALYLTIGLYTSKESTSGKRNTVKDRVFGHPKRLDVSGISYLELPDACQTGRKTKYIFYTHTATKHFEERDNLRKTWANASLYERNFFQMFFIMGRSATDTDGKIDNRVRQEAARHRDVLYIDFMDTYYNLTHKNGLAIEYVNKYCSNLADYILKTDDDIVINVPALDKKLVELPPESLGLVCVVFRGSIIIRSKEDKSINAKHYLGPDDYPIRNPDRFPTYCSGCGIGMTMGLMKKLKERMMFEPYVRVDDVYYSGTLTEHLDDVKRISVRQMKGVKEAIETLQTDWASGVLFRQLDTTEDFFKVWNLLRLVQSEASFKAQRLNSVINNKL